MQNEHESYTKNLETALSLLTDWFNAMHYDFAKCAKDNISPCHYCVNDETCSGNPQDCNFFWNKHN